MPAANPLALSSTHANHAEPLRTSFPSFLWRYSWRKLDKTPDFKHLIEKASFAPFLHLLILHNTFTLCSASRPVDDLFSSNLWGTQYLSHADFLKFLRNFLFLQTRHGTGLQKEGEGLEVELCGEDKEDLGLRMKVVCGRLEEGLERSVMSKEVAGFFKGMIELQRRLIQGLRKVAGEGSGSRKYTSA